MEEDEEEGLRWTGKKLEKKNPFKLRENRNGRDHKVLYGCGLWVDGMGRVGRWERRKNRREKRRGKNDSRCWSWSKPTPTTTHMHSPRLSSWTVLCREVGRHFCVLSFLLHCRCCCYWWLPIHDDVPFSICFRFSPPFASHACPVCVRA